MYAQSTSERWMDRSRRASSWLAPAWPVARRVLWLLPLLYTAWFLARSLRETLPELQLGLVPGFLPTSPDYAYGAEALLQGHYTVNWSGEEYIPRYGPGFPFLLMPVVALGGVEAAVLVPYVAVGALAMLASTLAMRLACPLGAALAVYLVLAPDAPRAYGQVVMSDVPAAVLVLAQATLLAFGRGRLAAVGAGLLGGFLVCTRVDTVVLALAALAGASARADWKRCLSWYALGFIPFLLFLATWQATLYGSPFTTGYQTLDKNPKWGFFSPLYATREPQNYESGHGRDRWDPEGIPNLPFYARQLLGQDGYLTLTPEVVFEQPSFFEPGVNLPGHGWKLLGTGALGLVGLLRLAFLSGGAGVLGRFGLVAIVCALAVYSPYYYQSPRFMLMPATFLNLGAAVLLAEGAAIVGRWTFSRARVVLRRYLVDPPRPGNAAGIGS